MYVVYVYLYPTLRVVCCVQFQHTLTALPPLYLSEERRTNKQYRVVIINQHHFSRKQEKSVLERVVVSLHWMAHSPNPMTDRPNILARPREQLDAYDWLALYARALWAVSFMLLSQCAAVHACILYLKPYKARAQLPSFCSLFLMVSVRPSRIFNCL